MTPPQTQARCVGALCVGELRRNKRVGCPRSGQDRSLHIAHPNYRVGPSRNAQDESDDDDRLDEPSMLDDIEPIAPTEDVRARMEEFTGTSFFEQHRHLIALHRLESFKSAGIAPSRLGGTMLPHSDDEPDGRPAPPTSTGVRGAVGRVRLPPVVVTANAGRGRLAHDSLGVVPRTTDSGHAPQSSPSVIPSEAVTGADGTLSRDVGAATTIDATFTEHGDAPDDAATVDPWAPHAGAITISGHVASAEGDVDVDVQRTGLPPSLSRPGGGLGQPVDPEPVELPSWDDQDAPVAILPGAPMFRDSYPPIALPTMRDLYNRTYFNTSRLVDEAETEIVASAAERAAAARRRPGADGNVDSDDDPETQDLALMVMGDDLPVHARRQKQLRRNVRVKPADFDVRLATQHPVVLDRRRRGGSDSSGDGGDDSDDSDDNEDIMNNARGPVTRHGRIGTRSTGSHGVVAGVVAICGMPLSHFCPCCFPARPPFWLYKRWPAICRAFIWMWLLATVGTHAALLGMYTRPLGSTSW